MCSCTHEKHENGLASAGSMAGPPIAARKADCVDADARGWVDTVEEGCGNPVQLASTFSVRREHQLRGRERP